MAEDPTETPKEDIKKQVEPEIQKELERMKQDQRLKQLHRARIIATGGSLTALALGQKDLAEDLYHVSELTHGAQDDLENQDNPEKEGALRHAAGNVGWKVAGKLAGEGAKIPFGRKIEGAGLGRGKAAAIGGAVAGALQGQGAKGIAVSAANWYVVDIAFGAMLTIVGFIPALLYLDFHYLMSVLGSKLFQPLFLWQKIALAIANFLVILIIALFFGIFVGICNLEGITGTVVRWMAGLREPCKYFTVDFGGGRSGGAGGGASFAQLDIVVTSAYRSGSRTNEGKLSAHGRGEAIDIALRNPTVPIRGSDPRIAQLVAIAKASGFAPLPGDTLDEYANPTCEGDSTCGGHVHVEFNLKPDLRTTFCDDTVVKDPPTDLVPIPSSIPVQGASDPRIRPCMLSPISAIFDAAQAISED